MLYAEVAVEGVRRLVPETYTYAVPPGVEVVPGQRVLVPLSRRTAFGYIIRLSQDDPGIPVRPLAPSGTEPLLLPHQMELATLVAERCWAPLIEVLAAMLPPRVRHGRSAGEGPSARQRRTSPHFVRATARPPQPDQVIRGEVDSAVASARACRVALVRGPQARARTEVYVALARESLAAGLGVLILVPEIGQSDDLVTAFGGLGSPIGILHTGLTALERAQQWWRIRRGELRLVIGSRSAVFAPIARLGLICLEEEGSAAYKQDRTPRYEAGWVARRLAEVAGARIVLGAGAPSLATYHEAAAGGLGLVTLPPPLPPRARIELVDMREERTEGQRGPLSRRLTQAIDRSLEDAQQVVLFLNRRGLATWFHCRDCGGVIECPGCSVAMVEHHDLVCHYCGYTMPVPSACPACGGLRLRGMGTGTQRLERQVRKTWPAARVVRLDRDSASAPDHPDIFEAFASGSGDVLVGTQMAFRAMNLERVTTVGIVDADLPLHFPAYRSAESAFALLLQAADRAGAHGRAARLLAQTSNPDHHALRRAAEGDYPAFYEEELAGRRAFGFPPFGDLATLTYTHTDDGRAEGTVAAALASLRAELESHGLADITLQGPSPAFIHRLRGEFRWQITVRGTGLARLRPLIPDGRGWSADVDPRA